MNGILEIALVITAMFFCDRFICIYPAYLNNKKTIAEGRRIPISKVSKLAPWLEGLGVALLLGSQKLLLLYCIWQGELKRTEAKSFLNNGKTRKAQNS